MSDYSSIQWTDSTWNPVTGCTKVSQGCKNCYAERVFPRAYGKDRQFTDVRTHADRLDAPLHWRKPRRVFVNSMSDLFHEDVPDDFIAAVFTTMAKARQHTFQVLTKRPERMRTLLTAWAKDGVTLREGFAATMPNVWLGVSCEDQETANERIPLLLQTPAAVRFLSCEPLLEAITLTQLHHDGVTHIDALAGRHGFCIPMRGECAKVDWVIIGGESGPKARPFDVLWARDIIAQCKAAGVPCFVKQLGALPTVDNPSAKRNLPFRYKPKFADDETGYAWVSLSDRAGGDMSEWPADLRVREYPA